MQGSIHWALGMQHTFDILEHKICLYEARLHIGLCRISFILHGSHSLKEKRGIAQSLIGRTCAKFNVAIAEVDDNDLWQKLTLGISCVSNDGRHANEVISKVVGFLSEARGEAEMLDYETEFLSAF